MGDATTSTPIATWDDVRRLYPLRTCYGACPHFTDETAECDCSVSCPVCWPSFHEDDEEEGL